MIYKIGYLGTHGVGKSTLALMRAALIKAVSPEKEVAIITETVRTCPWPVNRETTTEAQTWIFLEQMQQELVRGAAADVLVCDRTILDNLAYAMWAGFSLVVNAFLMAAIYWIRTYDELIFVRPDGPVQADGFRDTDLKYQRDIDRLLVGLIHRHRLKVTEVMAGQNAVDQLNELKASFEGKSNGNVLNFSEVQDTSVTVQKQLNG